MEEKIYPLTVVADRYNGTYSGGRFLAFNLDSYDVPTEIHEDDVTCMNFWYNEPSIIVGKGKTMKEAVEDLYKKMVENNIEF